MSRLQDVIRSIQDDIELGVLSFKKIAEKYDVPIFMVNDAWDELCEQYEEEDKAMLARDDTYPDYDSMYEDRLENETYL